MRRVAALLLFSLAAGCGTLRRTPPPPVLVEAPPPPPPRPRTLGCLEHPSIAVWERRLRSHDGIRFETRKALARGARYLPELRRILAESGLPPSLALLPIIESSFHPDARGKLDELGLWQLRAATARRFGLRVGADRDDRLNPARSTRAAALYLRLLHRRYGDWPLALAAYNAGERRVDRALRRRPRASVWQLAESRHLPRASREYVARFVAVVKMVEGVRTCTLSAQAERPTA